MKYFVLIVALLAISSAMHTSSFWEKKGVNVKDKVYEQVYDSAVNVTTQCSTVELNVDPYKYNGTVRSGYLSVGKGNSALGFIFYGR